MLAGAGWAMGNWLVLDECRPTTRVVGVHSCAFWKQWTLWVCRCFLLLHQRGSDHQRVGHLQWRGPFNRRVSSLQEIKLEKNLVEVLQDLVTCRSHRTCCIGQDASRCVNGGEHNLPWMRACWLFGARVSLPWMTCRPHTSCLRVWCSAVAPLALILQYIEAVRCQHYNDSASMRVETHWILVCRYQHMIPSDIQEIGCFINYVNLAQSNVNPPSTVKRSTWQQPRLAWKHCCSFWTVRS